MNQTSSKLLIEEEPLQVLPSLAVKLGLNCAMFLQQVHYWLKHSKHEHDGRKWIYNTYEAWHEQFPFWSAEVIRKRIVKPLEDTGVLLTTGDYNTMPMDKTKWYAIDYARLDEMMADEERPDEPAKRPDEPDKIPTRAGQNDHTRTGQNDHTNNQRIQETTTENSLARDSQAVTADTFVEYLAEELNSADVPYTRSWRGRHGKDFKESLQKEVPEKTLYKACDRIVERWTGPAHYKLTVEQALGDVVNGQPPRAAGSGGAPRDEVNRPSTQGANTTEAAARRAEGYEWMFEGRRHSDAEVREYQRRAMEAEANGRDGYHPANRD